MPRDGDQLLAELNATATRRISEYAYYPGIDRPLALLTGDTLVTQRRFFIQDGLGNVIGVLRDTLIDQKITYDPWGRQQQVTGTLPDSTSRLRWKGLLWDGVASAYYMRNRWYDPQTGRFLSEDPLGLEAGLNPYAFAQNDPVGGLDPFGLDAEGEVVRCPPGFKVKTIYPVTHDGVTAYVVVCENDQGEEYRTLIVPVYELEPVQVEGDTDSQPEEVPETPLMPVPNAPVGPILVGAVGAGAGLLISWKGGELVVRWGTNGVFRLAPYGHRIASWREWYRRLPHYHHRGPGGVGRHRPWQSKPNDSSAWDRF
jgi:RHS repeat-associated protein